ncbi:MAG: fused MFS/spermidine synthase, partial [Verrucomicrobiae bacterium]|nr:fused MFS/spermidine synthase [Verrucomicrobiae bacterium]
MSGPDAIAAPTGRERLLVLLSVGALGLCAVMTQLALMREMLGVFWGNEMVLGIILGNWLLLTGLGAWLGRRVTGLASPRRALIISQLLIALVPLAQVFLLRALRNLVFGRGVMVGVVEILVSSCLVLLPFCLVSGWMLTLACAILAAREGAEGIGRVYVADSIGSIVGGLVFSFVLVQLLDHIGILYAPALLNVLVACALAFAFHARVMLGVSALLTAALLGVMALADADAISTRMQYPDQRIVFRANSPYGKLVVSKTSGQFNFVENGLPVLSTENAMQVEEPVHYAMVQRPDAGRVLLIGGGVAGTAREILKYGVGEVTYVELDPLIIKAGRKFLPDSLADPRIRVVNTDGRLFVRQTAQRFDVVIVDMPDPSTSQINRFYTAEFFSEAKRALTANGVLSFGLGRYENYVSPELGRMLSSAHATVKRSFRNTLLIPGGRVFFLASDGDLHEDIAARI